MRAGLRYWLLLTAGWGFLLLGVAGLFLPFLQGILFIVIGLMLLARVSPRARLLVRRARARWPRTFARAEETRALVQHWINRRLHRRC